MVLCSIPRKRWEEQTRSSAKECEGLRAWTVIMLEGPSRETGSGKMRHKVRPGRDPAPYMPISSQS